MTGKINKSEMAEKKDRLLELLRANNLSFKEIANEFPDEKRMGISNWIASLRALKLVDVDWDGKNFLSKKYFAISDKTYSEVIKEKTIQNNIKRQEAFYKKQEDLKPNPYGRVYKMEDFGHKSKGSNIKISSWQGYTTFGDAL